ncbi:MAG TPA: EamA family transporter [Candidatus Limnocylindria bacterium]|nr:EamA family transporter [Candidatus Limnocylindria bacterium]
MSRPPPPGATDPRINAVVFVAIALIGGGNPVGVNVAVDELDPLWAAAIRFLAAGAIFAIAMPLVRIPVPRGRALLGALIYGVFAFAGSFAFLFWGLQETPPGTAQVIIALAPLFTLLLTIAHGLERFRPRALVGALVALGGLVFLMADRIEANVPLLSLLAVVAGAALLAESAVVIKLTPRAHPVATNAVGMVSGGAILLLMSAAAGDGWLAPQQSDTWVAMVFLVLGGSVAVFGLYLFLLGRWTASSASYVLLLQPVAAIVYSAILTDEVITPALFVGAAIVLVGVYIGAFSADRSVWRPARGRAVSGGG